MSARSVVLAVLAFVNRRRVDRDLAAEIDEHLKLAEDAYRARGLDPQAARAAARREFGSPALARQVSREEWGWPALDDYVADLRFGSRILRKHWVSSLVAVVALAVGIGATSGVVSTLTMVWHYRFPFAESDRLAILWAKSIRNPQYDEMQVSLPELRAWQQGARSVRLAGYSWVRNANVAIGQYVDRVRAVRVTSDVFALLGVQPMLGRRFTRDDDAADVDRAVIVSNAFWRGHLGGRADAVGTAVTLDRRMYTVVGVLPRGFELPMVGDVPVLLPASQAAGLDDATARSMVAIGRLAPNATVATVGAELDALSGRYHDDLHLEPGQWAVKVDPLAHLGRADSARTISTLFLLSWLVLLVACCNVAILLLARLPARQQELAVRMALGAGRRRIIRQLLLEAALVSTAASALGIAAAAPVNRVLVHLISESLPFTIVPHLTTDALVSAVALAAITCLAFGVAPALVALRAGLGGAATVRLVGSRDQTWFRNAAVAVEVAMSVVLLVGGLLMIESVRRMHETRLGFDPNGVVTARVTLDAARYPASAEQWFWPTLLERLAQRAEVHDASIASSFPLAATGDLANAVTSADARADTITAGSFVVGPRFFSTLRVPFVAGTAFNASNVRGGVIVDEVLAGKLWPSQPAVGHRLRILQPMFDDGQRVAAGDREVVGVVRSVANSLLRSASQRRFPLVYVPSEDNELRTAFVIVRAPTTEAGSRAIREVVQGMDPLLPVYSVRSTRDMLAYWYAPVHLDALMSGALAGVGVLLTIIGVYSVVTVFASQRRREIGVRVAIGAQPVDIVRLVLGKTLMPAVLGGMAGALLAVAGSRAVAGMLYDTAPLEPRAFVAAAAVIALVVGVAAAVPAVRASRFQPLIALTPD